MAQRLVRRVCSECAVDDAPSQRCLHELGLVGASNHSFVRGSGCTKCMNLGYKGRIGVYELLCATKEVRALIDIGASVTEIASKALEQGMRLMLQDGIEKAKMGLTTIDEIRKLHATVEIKLAVGDEDSYKLSA